MAKAVGKLCKKASKKLQIAGKALMELEIHLQELAELAEEAESKTTKRKRHSEVLEVVVPTGKKAKTNKLKKKGLLMPLVVG